MVPDRPFSGIGRRTFFKRFLKTAAAMAVTGAAGWWFHDPAGPPAPGAPEGAKRILDFALSGSSPALPHMAIVRGAAQRGQALEAALSALGGIERFVSPGDRVLVKVNAAFAAPAILSATTHPDLVAGITALCIKAGAARVVVTDNPINDPAACFQLTGIAEAAERSGARLVLPQARFFRPMTVPEAALIRKWPVLLEPFEGINKLIGVAPVKDHHRSGASMTLKNWYGLLGGRRNVFHQDIHTIILELARMVRPTLVILDGTDTMMANGPTGGSLSDLKPTRTLIAGTDPVAVDAFGATLFGPEGRNLPYIHRAQAAGLGTADYRSLKPEEIAL